MGHIYPTVSCLVPKAVLLHLGAPPERLVLQEGVQVGQMPQTAFAAGDSCAISAQGGVLYPVHKLNRHWRLVKNTFSELTFGCSLSLFFLLFDAPIVMW